MSCLKAHLLVLIFLQLKNVLFQDKSMAFINPPGRNRVAKVGIGVQGRPLGPSLKFCHSCDSLFFFPWWNKQTPKASKNTQTFWWRKTSGETHTFWENLRWCCRTSIWCPPGASQPQLWAVGGHKVQLPFHQGGSGEEVGCLCRGVWRLKLDRFNHQVWQVAQLSSNFQKMKVVQTSI